MLIDGVARRSIMGGVAKMGNRKPSYLRDSSWLAGADILAVGLALLGQLVLTRALAVAEYGMWMVILDLFAALYLLLDAGLPTLLARDGARSPQQVHSAVQQIWKIQATISVPFVLLTLPLVIWLYDVPNVLLFCAALISLAHIASYAPRSGLRAMGEARLEAISKLVERGVMTLAYVLLLTNGVNEVAPYAFALLFGSFAGLMTAIILELRVSKKQHSGENDLGLGEVWSDWKSLVIHALPFAVTVGVLPYVTKFEKFFLAYFHSYEMVAVYHVAQLAWVAGLVLPQAMRSSLLSVLGASRDCLETSDSHLEKAHSTNLYLIPGGMVLGGLVVPWLIGFAFPSSYSDGSLGIDAGHIFLVLIPGWGLSMAAVPYVSALQAGDKPWRFAGLILSALVIAIVAGLLLIPTYHVYGAAVAAVVVTFGMLLYSLKWATLGTYRGTLGSWLVIICSILATTILNLQLYRLLTHS